MKWKLYLDDERYPTTSGWTIARNVAEAKWYVENYGLPSEMSLDHDLGANNFTGYDFIKWYCGFLATNFIDHDHGKFDGYNDIVFCNVHSANPVGADNIRKYLLDFGDHYDVTVVVT